MRYRMLPNRIFMQISQRNQSGQHRNTHHEVLWPEILFIRNINVIKTVWQLQNAVMAKNFAFY